MHVEAFSNISERGPCLVVHKKLCGSLWIVFSIVDLFGHSLLPSILDSLQPSDSRDPIVNFL